MISPSIRNLIGVALSVSLTGSALAGATRVIHASADAPGVDIVVNNDFGSPALTGLTFGTQRGYFDLPAANYDFSVVPAGLTMPVVASANFPIADDVDQTIIAGGVFGDDSAISLFRFEDDRSPVAPDTVRIRAIHLNENAGAVDITVPGLGLFSDGLTFGNDSGYLEIPAGTYTIEVRGDTLTNDGAIVRSFENLNLAGGSVLDVLAVGEDASTLDALIVPEPSSLMLLALAVGLLRRR